MLESNYAPPPHHCRCPLGFLREAHLLRAEPVVADSLVSEVRVKDGTLLQTLDKASGCYVRQSAN